MDHSTDNAKQVTFVIWLVYIRMPKVGSLYSEFVLDAVACKIC